MQHFLDCYLLLHIIDFDNLSCFQKSFLSKKPNTIVVLLKLWEWGVKKAIHTRFEATLKTNTQFFSFFCDFVYYFDHFSRILLEKTNLISKLSYSSLVEGKIAKIPWSGVKPFQRTILFCLIGGFALLLGALRSLNFIELRSLNFFAIWAM